MNWRRGDRVIVVTVDEGLPCRRGRAPKAVPWLAEVVGPSALGSGWWLVRKINPKTGKPGYSYAVPESEMQERVPRSAGA